MSRRALTCPHCGGLLPPRAYRVVVVCRFCGASVAEEGEVVHAATFRRALVELSRERSVLPRVEVADMPYRVLGRVGTGESSDVFLAERAQPITERVLIKVLRTDADADLLEREWETLAVLHAIEAPYAGEMARRLPAPVSRGRLQMGGRVGRRALVVRAQSGFVDTFDDVMRAFPGGVDGRHAVWMWRRILELLTGVHRSGFAHGAVLPQHLVVHARDHGVMLVGWSCAARLGASAPLPAISTIARDCYPAALVAGAAPSAATDLTMSARSVARLLGGTATGVPRSVPPSLAKLVESCAAGRGGDDAWALRQRVGAAAEEAYGPPQYHPFPMPGWRLEGVESW